MDFFKRTFGLGQAEQQQQPTDPKPESSNTEPAVDHNTPQQSSQGIGSVLKSLLSGKLGSDVMSAVSLPAWLYEPLTILQRSCETLAHSRLLDKAAQCQDPIDRLVWVAAFGISGYCGSERFYTNFNPLLGETFEFIDSQNGMKFIAEQVSHHPPITASHAHNENFIFWQDTRVKTKFLGNSIEINTNAKTHVQLPKTSDHFYYTCPFTRVHNLLIGSFWLEHYGELNVVNKLTNDTCVIQFKKSGFFSRTNYEFEGVVKNAQGVDCVQLSGKWNEKIVAKWLVGTSEHAKDSEEVLFEVNTAEYYDKTKFKLTPFAHRLMRPTELLTAQGQSSAAPDEVREQVLCITDSRLRPDRRWLQYQQTEHATAWKKTLEERQRHDRRVLAQYKEESAQGTAKEPYVATGPVWFAAPSDSESEWSFKGDYWLQREEKERVVASEGASSASAVMVHESKKNKACDFRSYQHALNNAPVPPAPHQWSENNNNNNDNNNNNNSN